jgi:hypothetical protein
LKLKPISLREAGAYVDKHHRHHPAAKGWKFGVSVEVDSEIAGVATAGRPVARLLDDGRTIEITRCCTDGTRNVASKLYGAVCRAATALGYERAITYTLESESGDSLRASGFAAVAVTRGKSWNTPSRKRVDSAPICAKTRWERTL